MSDGERAESAGHLAARFRAKHERVLNLIAAAAIVRSRDGEGSDGAAEDVLRATVVLLHAAVEDLLREAQREALPAADAAVLDGIGFPVGAGGRVQSKDSLKLGELADQHGGRTVAEVVALAVGAALDRRPYNHLGDVAAALHTLKLPASEVIGPDGGSLSRLMLRRHQIAHHGDHRRGDPSPVALEPVDPTELNEWLDAVVRFAGRFAAALSRPEPGDARADS